jgi:hypothetical protein
MSIDSMGDIFIDSIGPFNIIDSIVHPSIIPLKYNMKKPVDPIVKVFDIKGRFYGSIPMSKIKKYQTGIYLVMTDKSIKRYITVK